MHVNFYSKFSFIHALAVFRDFSRYTLHRRIFKSEIPWLQQRWHLLKFLALPSVAGLSLCPLIPSIAYAEPCEVSTNAAKLKGGATIFIGTQDCQDSGNRVVTVSIQRLAEPMRIVLSKTQSLNDAAHGGVRLFDLEEDGVPEIELTGSCGAGPNCERDIYKVSKDQKSIYLYYRGGYSEAQQTSNYFVTASRDSCCAWEYIAYAPTARTYPLKRFRYSVFVGSNNNKLVCKIQELTSKGSLVLATSPPEELLKFCKHYGEDVPVTILKIKSKK